MHRTCLLACGRILLGAAFLFAGACSQGEGERCQVDSDCSGGLYCDRGDTGNGTCKSRDTRNDAAVATDARDVSTADAPADAAVRTDVVADGVVRSDVAVDLAPVTPVDADNGAADVPAGLPDLAIDTASLDGPASTPVDAQPVDSAPIETGAID